MFGETIAFILCVLVALLIFCGIAFLFVPLIQDINEPYYKTEISENNTKTANVYMFSRSGRKTGQYTCYKFELKEYDEGDKWHYTGYKSLIKEGIKYSLLFMVFPFGFISLTMFDEYNIAIVLIIMFFVPVTIFTWLFVHVYSAYKTLLELIRKETEV